MAARVDLLDDFTSDDSFRKIIDELLLPALDNAASPALAVLAFQGLYAIKDEVERKQFDIGAGNEGKRKKNLIQQYLRKWRCETELLYMQRNVKKILRSLTIFKAFEVPLFIDDYGEKKPMKHYEDIVKKKNPDYGGTQSESIEIVALQIDQKEIDIKNVKVEGILKQYIVHVTHSHEAQQIVDTKMLKPSDNKNSMEGIWFALEDHLGNPPCSVYGTQAFGTTLAQLGVKGLRQGEIVSYKNEVNVILYASNENVPDAVVKIPNKGVAQVSQSPTSETLNSAAYVHVSIFVPKDVLPEENQTFPLEEKFTRLKISHKDFCVQAKRKGFTCVELDY